MKSKNEQWDLNQLGKTHCDRMLSAMKQLAYAGDDGLSITKLCEKIYDGDSVKMSKCRYLWETAINDLGIIGMCKEKVTKGVFYHYITIKGKIFLQENEAL